MYFGHWNNAKYFCFIKFELILSSVDFKCQKSSFIELGLFIQCDNYSREETFYYKDFLCATSIQGRQLFKGGNYSRKYGKQSVD